MSGGALLHYYLKYPSIMKSDITPFIATHPGELIKDELRERNMSRKQLSEMSGVSASVLSDTINGKRGISLSVALAIEKALDIPAEMLMTMQGQYDVDMARIEGRSSESLFSSARILLENLLRKVPNITEADRYELGRIDALVHSYSI